MKIGFVSLGCPKNLVDTEVMLGLARAAGHEIVAHAPDAEVVVVNTCGFIDRAKQESVDTILEMTELKRSGQCRQLVVTGCLAERYRDELREQIPEIDVLLGIDDVPHLPAALAPASPTQPVELFRHPGDLRRVPGASKPVPTYVYDADTPRLRTTPPHLAYLKIAEGCDYACTFCIIPTLRGRYRSRPAPSIASEAERLAREGVKELILVSQDTTFYGIDRGERGALARLLRRLNEVDGLERIRLMYLYPTTIGDDAIEAIGDCEKVCNYIDLPLQHAAPDVLRRMGRPGSGDGYARLLERIRRRLPDVTLRTTFIVGFPGESDAEFEALRTFVRDIEFDHVGVFTYSHEADTRAHALPDDVAPSLKRRRRDAIMALQKRIVTRRNRRRLGRTDWVLVDGRSAEHELVVQGRLASQAPEIDPVVYLTDCDPSEYPAGETVRAEIVGASGYDLLARPLP